MRLLRRLLASVLAAALAATAVVQVLAATAYNGNYLTATAQTTGLADGLAAVLPSLADNYDPTGTAKAAVASVLTPEFVNEQLAQVLPALATAYQTGTAAPSFNLTGLGDQLEARGVPLPPALQSLISTPLPAVPAAADAPLRTVGSLTELLHWAAPVTAAVAALLLLAIGGRRRFATLAAAVAGGALSTAIAAGLLQLPPFFIKATLDNSAAKVVAAPVTTYLQRIASDQLHQLLTWAAGFLTAAIIIWFLGLILGAVRHRRAKAEANENERQVRD